MKAKEKEELKKDIIDAYTFLRENNSTIPSQSLDFIKQAALKRLELVKLEIIPELLEMLRILQKRLEILINLTPTGDKRNQLTEENILTLHLIQKATE